MARELHAGNILGLTAPTYWDGHHIGDGDAGPQRSMEDSWHVPHERLAAIAILVRSALDSSVVQTGQTVPVGTSLAAADNRSGIFITHVETLVTSQPATTMAMVMTAAEVPAKPLTTLPMAKPEQCIVPQNDFGHAPLVYQAETCWSVTESRSNGPRRLYSIPTATTIRQQDIAAAVKNHLRSEWAEDVVVGQTQHTVRPAIGTDVEVLRRVTAAMPYQPNPNKRSGVFSGWQGILQLARGGSA